MATTLTSQPDSIAGGARVLHGMALAASPPTSFLPSRPSVPTTVQTLATLSSSLVLKSIFSLPPLSSTCAIPSAQNTLFPLYLGCPCHTICPAGWLSSVYLSITTTWVLYGTPSPILLRAVPLLPSGMAPFICTLLSPTPTPSLHTLHPHCSSPMITSGTHC